MDRHTNNRTRIKSIRTELLGALHSERQRQRAPAVIALELSALSPRSRRRKPTSPVAKLRRRLGVLRRMFNESARVRGLSDAKFVLAGGGHKFREVEKDLVSNGLGAADITLLVTDCDEQLSVFGIARHGLAAANVFVWLSFLVRNSARLDSYFEVLCLYATYLRELRGKGKRYWIVIGDLSPHQIALAAAARRAGHTVISWQYDFLDFKRFPIRPDAAVVLNEKGIELARLDPVGPDRQRVYWRKTLPQRPVDVNSIANRPVGLLLNAFADQAMLAPKLLEISSILNQQILVRLHPNSRIDESNWPAEIMRRPPGESLEAFTRAVGMVICGNTSAQLKVLCLGAPIVQVPELDPLPFDHHGYVSKGIVFGVSNPDELSIDEVCQFYTVGSYRKQLQELLGPEAEFRKPSVMDLQRKAFGAESLIYATAQPMDCSNR